MKYQIVCNQPGRLRVRFGMYAFTKEQGYGIEEMLNCKAGIERVEASSKNGSLLICYNEGVRKAEILKLLKELKKDALPTGKMNDAIRKRETTDDFVNDIISMTLTHYAFKWLLPLPLRMINRIYRASGFIWKGVKALCSGKVNVEVLDAASIIAAFVQNSPETAGSIMFLLRISDRLEEYTRKQTDDALAESLSMNVDTVWLVTDGADVKVALKTVQAGDCIRMHAGNMIPVDGLVLTGDCMVNESSLTGESAAVHKSADKTVFAGTVVEDGEVVIRVTKTTNESRIANIISMIDNSESLKANMQGKAERLADSIVPFSFITSAATYLLTKNLTKAMSVLMVDYSCALKLSIPISIISAMREAADHKMLVKGGKYLENYAFADTILFDKTGTLTSASPKVAKVLSFEGYSREEVLRDAACLEEHFPHSVAKAVVNKAAEEGLIHAERHTKVEYIVAHGISTMLDGKRTQIGSRHFIFEDEGNACTEEVQRAEEEEMQGLSVIYLATGGRVIGMIGIEDPVRENAKEVIENLHKAGFRNIIMMTGDGEAAAKRVACELGIDRYYAQVLPEDKAEMVEKLKAEGRTVVMVGDGINDSPALAAADVSIAMKDSSDLAKEVADITLLTEDLSDLTVLRELTKGMMARVNGNYRFILGFNTSLMGLGIFGILAPQTTSVMHNISTMVISGLSMRDYLKEDKQSPVSAKAGLRCEA